MLDAPTLDDLRSSETSDEFWVRAVQLRKSGKHMRPAHTQKALRMDISLLAMEAAKLAETLMSEGWTRHQFVDLPTQRQQVLVAETIRTKNLHFKHFDDGLIAVMSTRFVDVWSFKDAHPKRNRRTNVRDKRTQVVDNIQGAMEELETKPNLTRSDKDQINLAIEEIARFATTQRPPSQSIEDASQSLHGLDEVVLRVIEAARHFAKPRFQAVLDAAAGKTFATADENGRFVAQLNHVRKLLGLSFHLVNEDGTPGEKVNLVHMPTSSRGIFRAIRTTAGATQNDRVAFTKALFPKLTLDQ